MSDKTQMMTQWWHSPLGQHVLSQEQQLLQSWSRHFYGHFQLQLYGEQKLLPDVSHPCCQTVMANQAGLDGKAELLPFKSHSIDNLLIPHVLEFSSQPHQVLREAERVLVADGSLVLCCFNPSSLWGLRRLFSWQDKPPWRGHFFSQARIKDWLALLNFEVIASKRILFRPPISSGSWLNRVAAMDRWGKRLWPIFGGVTILVATKRIIPLTPNRVRWQAKQFFPTGRFIKKPVTREISKPH